MASTTRAATPGDKAAYPWKYRIGQRLYVRGWPLSDTVQVLGGELWVGCPHYLALDGDGKTWRLPQLHVSSKPISDRAR